MTGFKDLTGERFGGLTVKYNTGQKQKGNGEYFWHCICDCGNEKDVRSGHLLSGATCSCGCYKIKKLQDKAVDLTGRRFGKLIVNYNTGKRSTGKCKQIIWHCTCDCGNETDVSRGNLKTGEVQSCGCLSESYIASEIKKYFVEKYNAETEYNILKNPNTGYWLPYDIYIPKGKNLIINGIYIEINGEQHYNLNRFHRLQAKKKRTTPDEEFNNQKDRDRLKQQFALENGNYIEIDLREINFADEAIWYIKAEGLL
jgi:hypothetical protein